MAEAREQRDEQREEGGEQQLRRPKEEVKDLEPPDETAKDVSGGSGRPVGKHMADGMW